MLRKRWLLAGLLVVPTIAWTAVKPSNERDWTPDNARLAWAEFRGDSVVVHNVRNAHYTTQHEYTVVWEDRVYDLRRLRSVWFGVEPFERDWRGPAHTFVSFGFDDGRYLAASVEIRKERGESFSPLKGVLRRFELIYVLGDERDVVKLRTNYRDDDVYLYPVRATPEQRREMFVEVLQRANRLREKPEFYNTIFNNCTTNLARHVNRISPGRVPFSYRLVLPGYADELALRLGILDTDLPIEQARKRFHINAQAVKYADDPEFSLRIRTPEPEL
ncbi:MAG TPA: DUF4105 domain-containing protein [Longimicrobiaceae bacterium]|nr:DUF4105 domain-containing protein [Longimicrobiaceae bacterium]